MKRLEDLEIGKVLCDVGPDFTMELVVFTGPIASLLLGISIAIGFRWAAFLASECILFVFWYCLRIRTTNFAIVSELYFICGTPLKIQIWPMSEIESVSAYGWISIGLRNGQTINLKQYSRTALQARIFRNTTFFKEQDIIVEAIQGQLAKPNTSARHSVSIVRYEVRRFWPSKFEIRVALILGVIAQAFLVMLGR